VRLIATKPASSRSFVAAITGGPPGEGAGGGTTSGPGVGTYSGGGVLTSGSGTCGISSGVPGPGYMSGPSGGVGGIHTIPRVGAKALCCMRRSLGASGHTISAQPPISHPEAKQALYGAPCGPGESVVTRDWLPESPLAGIRHGDLEAADKVCQRTFRAGAGPLL
jgi:hypothetical protein